MLTVPRAPLESDRRLVLAATVEEVAPLLAGTAAMASWFPVPQRTVTSTGRFQVQVPGVGAALHGQGVWHDDQQALVFHTDRPPLEGFVTVRAVILPARGLGTEIWVHLELPANLPGRRHLARLEAVVDAGLAHMQAELDRG